MRIISGTHKGKRLIAPKNLPVRPTTDFAKEALFNILNNRLYFQEVRLLDLFAGTGNISFEFASRGCEDITSVDAHFGCVRYIQKIAEELSFPITPIKSDVFKYTELSHPPFDVVFADPPYDFDLQQLITLTENIFQNNLLKPEGILIIEHSKHIDLSEVSRFQEDRKYGGSVFSFFA
ncbi:RsmD family RNA methyltransferase [Marinirhabdus gelatinilytica]|uniref:16S rRNA (Guanine(966)-N(2))-methyltransferase RsmD n=1 Tax=Marinirhabdus gelatinilytica TaxID=1703343 RepID=A0A370QAA5_9FLAO|nr:RsmD family RNA methyltransferase [Marinirhabdus gelatinilytica]RDK85311.1 16S rRNA (guanine(966)-N(2))-methyltransferase RsmD [Marinirhabdus gelatinilytica]